MDNIPDRLITINLSYYNQPKEILMRHIDSWKTYPNEIKNRFSFIIIDDCSKIPISNIIDKTDLIGLNIKLYRVKKDLYCNIAGVRNLGAQESKTPWLLILDMDTLNNIIYLYSIEKVISKRNYHVTVSFIYIKI